MTMGQRDAFRRWRSVGQQWLSASWGGKRPSKKSSSGLPLFHARIESLEQRNLLSVAASLESPKQDQLPDVVASSLAATVEQAPAQASSESSPCLGPVATVTLGFTPAGHMLADPHRNLVYMIDGTARRVLAIDTDLGRTVNYANLGAGGVIDEEMAISLDGDRLFVSHQYGGKIEVFSLPDLNSVAMFDVSIRPMCMAYGAGDMLYVADGVANRICQISATTGECGATLGYISPYHPILRTNRDGTCLYSAQGELSPAGRIEEYDISAPEAPAYRKAYWVSGSCLHDFAIDDQWQRIYSSQASPSGVGVIDMATGSQVAVWPFDAGQGTAADLLPEGSVVYAANVGSYAGWIVAYRRSDGQRLGSVCVGNIDSSGMEITPNGRLLFKTWEYTEGGTYLYHVGIVGQSTLQVEGVPVARFTTDQETSPGMNVVFDASQSVDYGTDEAIVDYQWDFGDGATASGRQVSHTYGTDGHYRVRLTVSDASGLSDDATAEIGVSRPPVAEDCVATTEEDKTVEILVPATDPDNDPIAFSLAVAPLHGSVTISGSTATYTPAADFHGSDQFTVLPSDGKVRGKPACVTVGVAPVNDQPIASDQTASVRRNTAKSILLKASDIDGDPLQCIIVTGPQHGTLCGSARLWTYSPDPGYTGADSFTYHANDGALDSATATVSLKVGDRVVADDQSVTLDEDTPLSITLQGNGEGTLQYTIVTPPQHGSLSGDGPGRVYTPRADYFGSDTFTFKVSDRLGTSELATVSLTILPINDPPKPGADLPVTRRDKPVTITNVLANDTDAEGSRLEIRGFSQATHGSVVFNGGGSFTYTPEAGFTGQDRFTYEVVDDQGASSTGEVLVIVLKPTEIHGAVWWDLNDDGVRQANEPGLAGVPVFLDANSNGQRDANEVTVTSVADDPVTPEDETGQYAFTNLTILTPYLVIEVPAGWRVGGARADRLSTGATHVIPIQAGQIEIPDTPLFRLPFTATTANPSPGARLTASPSEITVDFNFDVDPSTLDPADLQLNGAPASGVRVVDSDTVIFDLPPLADGSYTATIDAGAILSTAGTPVDAFGSQFALDTTPPVVTAMPKSTFQTRPRVQGTVDDPACGVWVTINGKRYEAHNWGDGTWILEAGTITPPLTPGGYDVQVMAVDSFSNVGHDTTTNELTILAPAGIEGRIWNDLDADGRMDAGEPMLPGVTVYLDLNRNNSLDANEPSTTTAADDPLTAYEDETGEYYFAGLEPGSYAVTALLAPGWQATVYTNTSQDSDSGGAGTGTGTIGGGSGCIISSGAALTADFSNAAITSDDVLESAVVSASSTFPPNAASNLIHLTTFRNDPRFAGIDGRKAAVVILDSGIDPDHPFFGPNADGNGVADRIVYQYDYVDGDYDASDSKGHGTHLAGIIGSQNATYAGMAPGVNIIALRVLDEDGKGDFGTLQTALQWVVQHASDYNIVAVNMSLGDRGNYTSPQSLYGIGDELATLAAQNVVVAAAAGNDFFQFNSALGVSYPAADPNVIAVGAVYAANYGRNDYGVSGPVVYSTGPDRITPYSQRDPSLLTVFAPGAVIVNAGLNGGVIESEGTSQAAAHVTGIAALAQQLAIEHLGRRLTAAEFRELLRSTGTTIRDGDDEDDNVTNTGLTFSRVDVMALAEEILQLDQVPGRELVRLGQDQVASYVDFGIHMPPDLGTIDYCTLSGQDATGGEAWYRFQAARDGILSAELRGVESGAASQITLYQESDGQAALGSQPTRLDAMDAKAGQVYVVHVTGFRPNATLCLANLVQRSGNEVQVFGTEAADTFTFDATSGRRVSINGLAYQFTSEISSVVIVGGSGEDRAELTGSPGDDSAVFTTTGGRLTGPGYRVMLANVAHTTLDAGDGTDVAYLSGTPGDDAFTADRHQGMLAGDGFSLKTLGFEKLQCSGAGGNDTAVLRDSNGAERLVAKPGNTELYGDGYLLQAKGFVQVTAYGTPGTGDVAQLYDSRGHDTFTASPEVATLVGTGFSLTAAGFDTVVADARSGGHDEAVLTGASGSDELRAYPQYGELHGLGYTLKAAHFDEFRAYGQGGDDVARMYDSMGDDQFVTNGLESQLTGRGFNNLVACFPQVFAYAGQGGLDRAELTGALGAITPRYGLLTGPGFACRVEGFASMLGPSSGDAREATSQSVSAVHRETSGASSIPPVQAFDAVYWHASVDELDAGPADVPADRQQTSGSATSLASTSPYLQLFYQALGLESTWTKSSWAKDRKDRGDLLPIGGWESTGGEEA